MELDEPIEIAAYDPAWPETFESEKSWIRQALMGFDVQIEHFGGTAVPGLDGRPVIDILVGVRRIQLTTTHLTNLLDLGYDEPAGGSAPRRFYMRKRGDVNAISASCCGTGRSGTTMSSSATTCALTPTWPPSTPS